MWAFVDHLVQQVSIQTLQGNPDIAVLQMSVDQCCKVCVVTLYSYETVIHMSRVFFETIVTKS